MINKISHIKILNRRIQGFTSNKKLKYQKALINTNIYINFKD